MDERQKIDWAQQDKKLLLLLEKQQALPTNRPFSMAKLNEEILAIEELVRSYQLMHINERTIPNPKSLTAAGAASIAEVQENRRRLMSAGGVSDARLNSPTRPVG